MMKPEEKTDKNGEKEEKKNLPDSSETQNAEEVKESISEEEQTFIALGEKLKNLHDQHLRLAAEFDNYKKRIQKERTEFFRFANQDLITELLDVIDDFERVLKSLNDSSDKTTKEGVNLIKDKLEKILKEKGLTAMNVVGEKFNPDLHDAVNSISVKDETKKGIIIEEVQKGYELHDRVIRHAKVVVGA